MFGRTVRLRRIFPPGGRRLFSVPLDHSVSLGPIEGLEAVAPAVRTLEEGGVDLVIVAKGAVRDIADRLAPCTLLGVHLSASTGLSPGSDRKRLVGTAREAVALGADLVSVQVNFGGPEESAMLADLGAMAEECAGLGMPLLCMAYVKSPAQPSVAAIQHACRAAADLGADIVKTSYPGLAQEFLWIVQTTPVPVLVGGGVRMEDEAAALAVIQGTIRAGGAGICIGRNLFQREPLLPFVQKVASLLHSAE